MTRTASANTKLVIAGYNRFTLWRTPPEMAERVRRRWLEMRVVDFATLPTSLPPELP